MDDKIQRIKDSLNRINVRMKQLREIADLPYDEWEERSAKADHIIDMCDDNVIYLKSVKGKTK